MDRAELEKMTKAELVGIADSILLLNRGTMSKPKLIDGILAAQDQDLVKAAETQAIGEDGEDENEPPPIISIEDYRKIRSASTGSLQELLMSGALDGYSERRAAVEQELLERRGQKPAPAKLEIETFKVTKGGRLWQAGCPYEIPVGAVVNRLTHDLKALKAAGIELQRVTTIETRLDQFDRPVTVTT